MIEVGLPLGHEPDPDPVLVDAPVHVIIGQLLRYFLLRLIRSHSNSSNNNNKSSFPLGIHLKRHPGLSCTRSSAHPHDCLLSLENLLKVHAIFLALTLHLSPDFVHTDQKRSAILLLEPAGVGIVEGVVHVVDELGVVGLMRTAAFDETDIVLVPQKVSIFGVVLKESLQELMER